MVNLYPFVYKVYLNILIGLRLETCLFPRVPGNFEIKDHRIYALKNSAVAGLPSYPQL